MINDEPNQDVQPEANHSWTNSPLVTQLIATLDTAQTLDELAANLNVTDTRILFYLNRLKDHGWVEHLQDSDQWLTTSAARHREQTSPSPTTTLPVPSAQDYVQAYVDAEVGMFAPGFVQASGEHGGRVPEERIREFNQRLIDLIDEYFAPDAIDRTASPKYGFRWILTPVDLHPMHDQ